MIRPFSPSNCSLADASMPFTTRSDRLPGPDVQRVEGRQTEAIRTLEQVQKMPTRLRVAVFFACPASTKRESPRRSAGGHRRAAARHDDLQGGAGPVRHQPRVHVDVMQSHRSVIGPADAAKATRFPPPSPGWFHEGDRVDSPNYPDQFARMLLVLRTFVIARACVRCRQIVRDRVARKRARKGKGENGR